MTIDDLRIESAPTGFSIMHKTLLYPLVLLTLVWSGCDGFTDLAPISQRNTEEYYQEPREFEVALSGAYDALQSNGTYGRNYWILFEMRSDNTDQGADVTGLARALAVVNDFEESTTSEIVQEAWSDSYQGIERTNIILDRIDDLEADQAFKDRIRGEALFIRSLLYYNLATAFGNITLKLEPTPATDPGGSVQGDSLQVPATDVYNQIAADLETAQGLLPLSAAAGQATRGAANALLGKVYLTLGQASDAQTALERVVDSGEYELLDDYADLWGPENENNDESIFEVQFASDNQGEGSTFTNTFAPSSNMVLPSGAVLTGEGRGENRPTEAMVDAYESGDARFLASMDTVYTNSDGEVVSARYVRKFESQPFQPDDADNNWPVLRYADVLLMLAEAVGPSGTTSDGRSGWDLINEVRTRAGLSDVTQDNFYARLLQERRVELAFENHRWPDLRRFDAQYDLALEDTFDEEGRTPSRPLFPIPQREVDVAGMQQNDL